MIDFMDAIRESKDFFAARTKNDGTMTTRVLNYQKGRFEGWSHYVAFGATAVASNKPLSDDVIASRSLVIQACEGTRRFLVNVTPELARELRERGTAFRARVLARHRRNDLPPKPDIAPGRLGDITSGPAWAAAICQPAAGDVLKQLIPSFATARHAEASDTIEVDALRVCITRLDSADACKAKLSELAEEVNATRVGERPLSGRGLAPILRASLGLEVFAGAGNQRFVHLDRTKLTALAKRYGLAMTPVNELLSRNQRRTIRKANERADS